MIGINTSSAAVVVIVSSFDWVRLESVPIPMEIEDFQPSSGFSPEVWLDNMMPVLESASAFNLLFELSISLTVGRFVSPNSGGGGGGGGGGGRTPPCGDASTTAMTET